MLARKRTLSVLFIIFLLFIITSQSFGDTVTVSVTVTRSTVVSIPDSIPDDVHSLEASDISLRSNGFTQVVCHHNVDIHEDLKSEHDKSYIYTVI